MKRFFRYLIRSQKQRVHHLEESLARARKMLRVSEEAYVRAYVSKYWRGKDLDASQEEIEELMRTQKEMREQESLK